MNNKIVYKISIEINENIMNGACDNHYRICLHRVDVVLTLHLLLFFSFEEDEISLRKEFIPKQRIKKMIVPMIKFIII
ncbi:hypothetical protein L0O88_03400 [Bacteroides nordii]|uniref:hypothetical protein n=1 Tax=Bacteroides nordii TaxID=291645 RepID=UPI001EDEA1FF|nr:hypothetical protein [Bacteroides nordii]MCG4768130.1 hypothetical protein [Bacteroides nordii]